MQNSELMALVSSPVESIRIIASVALVLEAAATCILAAAIWSGIRTLNRSTDEFCRRHEKAMAERREAEDRRREEATATPEDLIRRTAAPDSGTGE